MKPSVFVYTWWCLFSPAEQDSRQTQPGLSLITHLQRFVSLILDDRHVIDLTERPAEVLRPDQTGRRPDQTGRRPLRMGHLGLLTLR